MKGAADVVDQMEGIPTIHSVAAFQHNLLSETHGMNADELEALLAVARFIV